MTRRKNEAAPNLKITSYFSRNVAGRPAEDLPAAKRVRLNASASPLISFPDETSPERPAIREPEVAVPSRSELTVCPPTTSSGFQPFAKRDVNICPYVATDGCKAKKQAFGTYRDLCLHVRSTHQLEKPPNEYEENPFEDGTNKIPCPRACGEKFSSHQKANHHAKTSKLCPMLKRDNISCLWKDCAFVADGKDPEKGMANHIRAKHSQDNRSAYQCSKCASYFHMDLYKLAMHEERCTKESVSKVENTTMRFQLNAAARNDEAPQFIIVNRSSNRVPEGWKAGTDHYKTGLPIIGQRILAHFAAKTGHKTGAAVLHTAYECPTRRVPALEHDLSYLETDNRQKKMVYRGFKFTQAIVNDIRAANQAGIKPFVITQGVDGWFCDLKMIMTWLKATKLDSRYPSTQDKTDHASG